VLHGILCSAVLGASGTRAAPAKFMLKTEPERPMTTEEAQACFKEKYGKQHNQLGIAQ
jgi:hypothetical protein